MSIQENPDRSDVVDGTHSQTSTTVGTSAVEVKVGGSINPKRQIVYIWNDSATDTLYWGTSAVTTSGANKGVPLSPQNFVSLPFGRARVYVISDASSHPVTMGEVS